MRVIIYVPPRAQHVLRWLRECLDHIRARGYVLDSITSTGDGVLQAMAAGLVERAILARPDHLRLMATRVEVVTEVADHPPARTGRAPRPGRADPPPPRSAGPG